MKNRFFKKGFTLAEVITTLGVIGIVATVAIPMANQRKPNNDILMCKKAYNTIVRVVSEMVNDEEFYDPDRLAPNATGILADTAAVNTNGVNCPAGLGKFCCLFSSKVNAILVPACTQNDRRVITSDGIEYRLPMSRFAGVDGVTILVDVNGWDREPNTQEGQTPDRFLFSLSSDGRVSYGGLGGQNADIVRAYVEARDLTSRTYAEIQQRG